MELSKSQLESIRYQIKKLGETAGNDEIRKASESFQDFDAVVIAQHVINSQEFAKTALTVQNSQPVQNSQSALSVSQKQELVKIQAEFLGIELSQPEIQAIACQADSKIQDNLEFLREVQSLIKEFLAVRNQKFQQQTNPDFSRDVEKKEWFAIVHREPPAIIYYIWRFLRLNLLNPV